MHTQILEVKANDFNSDDLQGELENLPQNLRDLLWHRKETPHVISFIRTIEPFIERIENPDVKAEILYYLDVWDSRFQLSLEEMRLKLLNGCALSSQIESTHLWRSSRPGIVSTLRRKVAEMFF